MDELPPQSPPLASPGSLPLGELLRTHQPQLVTRAVEIFLASPLRLWRPVEPVATGQVLSSVVESLAEALSGSVRAAGTVSGATVGAPAPVDVDAVLRPGSNECREVEKSSALLGAILAASGASGFEVAALFHGFRAALAEHPLSHRETSAVDRYLEWLAVVALDSFATARAQAERERAREQLENGTPVVMITPEVPAAFLVGCPDGVLVDSVCSRLLLSVVRVGAKAVVIHAEGLVEPGREEVLAAMRRFLGHRKVSPVVHVLVVGLPHQAEPTWRALATECGAQVTFTTHFDAAVAQALDLSGYRLVSRS